MASAEILIWSAALVTAIRKPQFSSRPGDEGLVDGSGAPGPREKGVLSFPSSGAGDNSETTPSFPR